MIGTRGRRAGVALLMAVTTALSVAAPSHAAPLPIPCRGYVGRGLRENAMDLVQLRTFTVDMKPLAKSYKIGSVAKIAVTVTRPAHQDPLQLGPTFDPPASAPAAGANVGIGVHVGEVFVPGFSITNADGKATVSIKLPPYVRPGTAVLDGYSWKVQADSPCLTVEEDGFTHADNAFAVTK